MKRIVVHSERCYGCMTCEVACVTAHTRPEDEVTTETMMASWTRITAQTTRIWVRAQPNSHAPLPVTCHHCLDPACVTVCSAGSLQQVGEQETVVNDATKCAGCWMCIMVCPFGGINKLGRTAIKCDLCLGRAEGPACVAACPNGALELVDVKPLDQPTQGAERGQP